MPAKIERLGDLHAQLVETLIEETKTRQESFVEEDKDGNEVTRVRLVRPAPAWAAIARAVLKDSSVTADIDKDDNLQELQAQLDENARKRRVKASDVAEALQSIGKNLLN